MIILFQPHNNQEAGEAESTISTEQTGNGAKKESKLLKIVLIGVCRSPLTPWDLQQSKGI